MQVLGKPNALNAFFNLSQEISKYVALKQISALILLCSIIELMSTVFSLKRLCGSFVVDLVCSSRDNRRKS